MKNIRVFNSFKYWANTANHPITRKFAAGVFALFAFTFTACSDDFFTQTIPIDPAIKKNIQSAAVILLLGTGVSSSDSVLMLPIIYLSYTGNMAPESVYSLILMLVFYGYAVNGYMAVYALIVPWEFAGFIVCISILVNSETTNLVNWIQKVLGI